MRKPIVLAVIGVLGVALAQQVSYKLIVNGKADPGAAIVVNGRSNQAAVDAVAAEIVASGGRAIGVLADVSDAAAVKAYEKNLAELAKRPLSYVKISAVLRNVNGRVPVDVPFYKDRLDMIYNLFTEDRVVYGSDWPNSDNVAEYPAVFKIVSDYFATKTQAQREKYFWRNSIKAYQWKKRDSSQPA